MKRIISFLLCMVLVLGTASVFAAEPNWKSLYDEKMNEIKNEYRSGVRDDGGVVDMWGEGAYYFALLDINFDGVPELYHTLCSYFELDPETSAASEEIYYIEDGKVKKGAIESSGDLGLLPIYAGVMEDAGVFNRTGSRWQFVMKDNQTGEVCFLTHDGYSGMADYPERRYMQLIFDSKTGVVKAETLLYQGAFEYEEPQILTGYSYVAQGAYNTYTRGEYHIDNWEAGYLAPRVEWMHQTIEFDAPPVLVEGRTLVPIRRIAEALGATVGWEAETETVTITKGDIVIVMEIGQDAYTVNGEEKTLDVPAQTMSGRTMVPARAVSESLHCHVDWDEENWTVEITESL